MYDFVETFAASSADWTSAYSLSGIQRGGAKSSHEQRWPIEPNDSRCLAIPAGPDSALENAAPANAPEREQLFQGRCHATGLPPFVETLSRAIEPEA